MDEKEWVKGVKADMQVLQATVDVITKARDTVEAWDMTRKQANKFCMEYFKAALERNEQEEQQNG